VNCLLSEGYSLGFHRGHKFSTPDQDNDAWSSDSCAKLRHGAWWYSGYGFSNLNGRYYQQGGEHEDGVFWLHWKSSRYSLRFTEMKLRPA